MRSLLFLLSLPTICSCATDKYTGNAQLQLLNSLLDGYQASVRPVLDDSTTINLTITWNSLNILNMDQTEETLSFSAEFAMEWYDQLLHWNPSNFSNITVINIKSAQVWIPDVTVNTAVGITPLLSDDEQYVSVQYDGLVHYSLYAVFQNLCDLQVGMFPYDSQVCTVDVGPWSYTDREIHSMPSKNISGGYNYYGNSEWDFVDISTQVVYTVDHDVNFTYSLNRFELTVKRRPQFYVWVLLIPTFIITTIAIFGLFIPTNSMGEREEKVNLGLTTMLSHVVILQIVADSMPKSTQLPLLGNYILAEIFVVAIGVLISVVFLTLHHRAETRGWMPPAPVLFLLAKTGSYKFMLKKQQKMKVDVSVVNERKKSAIKGDSMVLLGQLDSALKELIAFVEFEERDKIRALAWLKFFDRLDIFCLVFFQAGNAIITWLLCKH